MYRFPPSQWLGSSRVKASILNNERPQTWVPFKKREIRIPFRAPLFLGKWCGVATYFFIQKKKKLNWIQLYMTELFLYHWLNKKEYIYDKLSIAQLWVLVTNYQRYMAFCPNYNLPKIKPKIKPSLSIQRN